MFRKIIFLLLLFNFSISCAGNSTDPFLYNKLDLDHPESSWLIIRPFDNDGDRRLWEDDLVRKIRFISRSLYQKHPESQMSAITLSLDSTKIQFLPNEGKFLRRWMHFVNRINNILSVHEQSSISDFRRKIFTLRFTIVDMQNDFEKQYPSNFDFRNPTASEIDFGLVCYDNKDEWLSEIKYICNKMRQAVNSASSLSEKLECIEVWEHYLNCHQAMVRPSLIEPWANDFRDKIAFFQNFVSQLKVSCQSKKQFHRPLQRR